MSPARSALTANSEAAGKAKAEDPVKYAAAYADYINVDAALRPLCPRCEPDNPPPPPPP